MTLERLRIWGGLFIASTVWGSTWLAIKIGLLSMPPIFSVTVRFAIALVVLGAIIRWKRLPIPFGKDDRKVYLSMGTLTFTLPFALVYWGQQFIPSALGSILFAAFPFWVALFSHLMLSDEKLTPATIAGMVICFIGIVVLFWGDLQIANLDAVWGMGAITVSVVIQALSLVQVKKWGKGGHPVVQNFVGMVFGMVMLGAASLLFEAGRPAVWNLPAILSLLYLALVGSVVAYVVYYWLLQKIDPVVLSLTSFVNPLVAILLGAVILGEELRPGVLGAAALVLGGLGVANAKSLAAKFFPAPDRARPS
jgi:drug/metabolite transporter (DMT)-like permease